MSRVSKIRPPWFFPVALALRPVTFHVGHASQIGNRQVVTVVARNERTAARQW